MLKDPYNRTVTNLRISLTSRCNLRCIYCHAEGEVNPKEQMSTDEIAELMRVGAQFGIRSVKFTGGEPMLRRDLVDIIRSVPPGVESSMTTNGTLLAPKAAELKEAGLARVNVSLDTLRPERYSRITGKDCLEDALEGIDAALQAGLTPVKINMVLLDGINEDEIDDFMAFVANSKPVVKAVADISDNDMILDIGPKTAQQFAEMLKAAKTILWNGPVGVFEVDAFGGGTEVMSRAIADSSAFSIAGGGDTLAAIDKYKVSEKISYISTGGGAFLEFVEGKELPAVAILRERAKN